MSDLKNEWVSDICNNPDDDFNLYFELLEVVEEREESRGRISRNMNEDLILTIYPSDSSVEIPLAWLLRIVAGAEKDLLRRDDPANSPAIIEGYGVVSTRKIGKEDLRRLVDQKEGGRWRSELGFGEIQVGEAEISIHLNIVASAYSPEELAVLKRMLGDDPASSVHVDYAPNDESERLAKDFCDELVKEFGGHFLGNYTGLIPEASES